MIVTFRSQKATWSVCGRPDPGGLLKQSAPTPTPSPVETTREVDLLSRAFRSDGGIDRNDGVFHVAKPWALARFGQVRISAGWWMLECEGEAGVERAEVRLTSARDPLIVLTGADAGERAHAVRILIQEDTTVWISLLASAWPGDVRFDALRLRRLSAAEELALIGDTAGRLIRGGRPLGMLTHVVRQFMAGAPLGFRPNGAARTAAVAAPKLNGYVLDADHRIAHEGGVAIQLRGDDELKPGALDIVNDLFRQAPGVMAIYTDVEEGGRLAPTTSWDPELAGRFDFGTLPLFLRNGDGGEQSDRWTTIGDIIATHGPDAVMRVPLPLVSRSHSLTGPLPALPRPNLQVRPSVSVIVPTKFRIDLLESCLTGLARRTDYPDIEVVVVDNDSTDPRLPAVLEAAGKSLRLSTVRQGGGFNFSRLVNSGVRASSGAIVVMLNDDVEPIEACWLDRMVESCLVRDVGAVGARLVYPDRSIQHAGVVLGIGGVCGHLWRGMSEEQAVRTPQVVYPGRRMAVTGACLAVRREVFEEVGGMDEALPVALNDIDFCLRLHQRGYRNIYRGDAVLIHHESQSRGSDAANARTRRRLARETELFLSRWMSLIENDPFGSPAFDTRTEAGAIHPVLADRPR